MGRRKRKEVEKGKRGRDGRKEEREGKEGREKSKRRLEEKRRERERGEVCIVCSHNRENMQERYDGVEEDPILTFA